MVESFFLFVCFTTLEQTTQLSLPIKTRTICFYPFSSLKQSHTQSTWIPVHRSSKATEHTVPTQKHFPPICRRHSQFLQPAGDTRLPTLTSVLQHIRFLPITIPLRSAGLAQPADFARTGLTCSIPQEVLTRKRNLEENRKKIISWHSKLSCYQCILHFYITLSIFSTSDGNQHGRMTTNIPRTLQPSWLYHSIYLLSA